MSENDEKKVIELSRYEADTLNKGLSFLINEQIKSAERISHIPEENLKDLSWLIKWKSDTFKK